MKKRHKTIKKATCYVALCYLAVWGLLYGIWYAAYQTRSTLYGDTQVLAQVSETAASQTKIITAGGGEWEYQLELPPWEQNLSTMPPCFLTCVWKIYEWLQAYAVQLTE